MCRSAECYSIMKQGCTNSGPQVDWATELCAAVVCGFYSVELVSCHGVWNLFVAPKLLENLCAKSIKSKLYY